MSNLYGWNNQTSGTRNNLYDIGALDYSIGGSTGGITRGMGITTNGASDSFILDAGASRVNLGESRIHTYLLESATTISMTSSTSGTTNYVAVKVDLTNATASIEINDSGFTNTASPEVYYQDLYTVVATGVSLTQSDFTQTAPDANIIKSSWTSANISTSYDSYSATTRIAKIDIGSGTSALFNVGMRVRFNQPTDGQKYGIIHGVEAGFIHVFMQQNSDVDNEAITRLEYSSEYAPVGFNVDPGEWSITLGGGAQSSPVATTWYTLSQITLGVGKYRVDNVFRAQAQSSTSQTSMSISGGVSTSTNNGDFQLTNIGTSGTLFVTPVAGETTSVGVNINTTTTFYNNVRTGNSNVTSLVLSGSIRFYSYYI